MVSKMPRQPKANDKAEAKLEASGVEMEVRDGFAIFEGHPSLDMARDLDQTLSDSALDIVGDINQTHSAVHPTQALVDDYGAHVLEVIEESPQHAYKLKRLSTASPEFGPTLKISRSAERFIMGPDGKTEKNPLNRKKSKELDRTMMKKDQKDRKNSANSFISASKNHPDRPSSSQGVYTF